LIQDFSCTSKIPNFSRVSQSLEEYIVGLSHGLYPSIGISIIADVDSPLVFVSCNHSSNDPILIVFVLFIFDPE